MDYTNQIKINIIDEFECFNRFYSSIKPKSVASISLACETIQKENLKCESLTDEEIFFDINDVENQSIVRFYGLFMSFEHEKQKLANLILIQNERKFLDLFKSLLEKEDIVKIMFFTKQHVKLLNKYFKIDLKSCYYDPIVANWLLTQETITIFQIKEKFCPNLNIFVDVHFKSNKSCYGCLAPHLKKKSKIFLPFRVLFWNV